MLDELVIRLGLDTTPLQANAKTALGTLNQLEGKSAVLGKTLAQTSKHSTAALGTLRREALGLLGLVCGGRGLGTVLQALKNTPASTTNTGRTPHATQPKNFAQGIKKHAIAPKPFTQGPSLPPFYTRPLLPSLVAGTALSPVGMQPKGFTTKATLAGHGVMPSRPYIVLPPHTAGAVARTYLASSALLGAGGQGAKPFSTVVSVKPQQFFLQNRVNAGARKTPYALQAAPLAARNSAAPPVMPVARPVVPVPFMVQPSKTVGLHPRRNAQPYTGKAAQPSTRQTVGPVSSLPRLGRGNAKRQPSVLVQARQMGGQSSFANSSPSKAILPAQPQLNTHGAGFAALPVAPLHALAMPSALAAPAAAQPAAPATTYIGPVTITVPSGNPQAIAQALRNLGAHTNHTLASLATRGTV